MFLLLLLLFGVALLFGLGFRIAARKVGKRSDAAEKKQSEEAIGTFTRYWRPW